jgi:hypothetical protein
MQMMMIFKRNTSLHNIKYLYPVKCIRKTKTDKKNPQGVPMYFSKI